MEGKFCLPNTNVGFYLKGKMEKELTVIEGLPDLGTALGFFIYANPVVALIIIIITYR